MIMAFYGLARSDWRVYEPRLVDVLSPLGLVHKPLPFSDEKVTIYHSDLPEIATNVGILVEQGLNEGNDVIVHLTLGIRDGFLDSLFAGSLFNIDLYERKSKPLNVEEVLRGWVVQQVSQAIPRLHELYQKSIEFPSIPTVKVIEAVREEALSHIFNRDRLLYVYKDSGKTTMLSYQM